MSSDESVVYDITEIDPIPKLAALYTIGKLGVSDEEANEGNFHGDATFEFDFIILYGGRGGGKSESVAQVFVLLSRVEKTRILCTREIQVSMKDSVYKMIEVWIYTMGFRDEFYFTLTSIRHRGTGTDFIFMGMETAARSDSLKSLKDVKYVWYEEAQTATTYSLEKLNPTIRINGRKLIFTMNRKTTKDAVIEYFEHRKGVLRININYMDNQYLPDALLIQALEDKELDINKYDHIWMGEPIPENSSRIVLPKSWLIQCVDLHKKIGYREGGRKTGGFDVADSMEDAADKNSVAFRQGPVVQYVAEWKIDQVYKSVDKINKMYPHHGFDTLYFDATALGVAAKSEFSRLNSKDRKLPYYVIPFMGGMKPESPDKVFIKHGKNKILNKDFFKNKKAQGWWNLRLRLENSMRLLKGQEIDREDYFLSFSSDIEDLDSILTELSQAVFDEDNSGRIKIDKSPGEREVVIDGKKTIRKSPNRADSIKYSFAGDLRGGLKAQEQGTQSVKVI